MAIQKEIWEDHIEGNLFKNNEFLLASADASQYVLQGKVVHIPQAGAIPGVSVNRSSLPATVGQRTDTDVTYELDEYTTDPILIPNADTIELSYNNRENVLAESQAIIRQTTAENLLVTWAPSASTHLMLTTGASVTAHLAGTTGNRKKFVVNDLKYAQLLLNKQNIPLEDRYALISADMFQQLTDDMSQTQYRDFSVAFDAKNGIVGKLFGFNIIMRSSVLVYSDDSTPIVRAAGAATAVTDNDAVLCWHTHAVERAVGDVLFFEKTGDPLYYGDVYSVCVRMGGRKRRNDEKGIIAIVQNQAS
ncbi:MAG: hypothetical protein H0X33_07085 [Taibaiella sp.]|nr:hypothetical protein [Taibaiella sp.]